jgi:hypothetical protein
MIKSKKELLNLPPEIIIHHIIPQQEVEYITLMKGMEDAVWENIEHIRKYTKTYNFCIFLGYFDEFEELIEFNKILKELNISPCNVKKLILQELREIYTKLSSVKIQFYMSCFYGSGLSELCSTGEFPRAENLASGLSKSFHSKIPPAKYLPRYHVDTSTDILYRGFLFAWRGNNIDVVKYLIEDLEIDPYHNIDEFHSIVIERNLPDETTDYVLKLEGFEDKISPITITDYGNGLYIQNLKIFKTAIIYIREYLGDGDLIDLCCSLTSNTHHYENCIDKIRFILYDIDDMEGNPDRICMATDNVEILEMVVRHPYFIPSNHTHILSRYLNMDMSKDVVMILMKKMKKYSIPFPFYNTVLERFYKQGMYDAAEYYEGIIHSTSHYNS